MEEMKLLCKTQTYVDGTNRTNRLVRREEASATPILITLKL